MFSDIRLGLQSDYCYFYSHCLKYLTHLNEKSKGSRLTAYLNLSVNEEDIFTNTLYILDLARRKAKLRSIRRHCPPHLRF